MNADFENATARPWVVWSDESGRPVSQIYTPSGRAVAIMADDDTPESLANAALIVRSVNEWEALCAVEEAARSAGAFPELTAALAALSAVREGGAK